MSADERHKAIYEISVQHEADCGKPGIFSSVTQAGGIWTAVIDHYDPADPLHHTGSSCRYTAANYWRLEREQ